ncbi:hypothetical protein ABK040_004775 [Willaertia magna]
MNLHDLPVEIFQIIFTFLIGNLNDRNVINKIVTNNNYQYTLPNAENIKALVSITNLNKSQLQNSIWINKFWKNSCHTLDLIYYLKMNKKKQNDTIGNGDFTDEEREELEDIQKHILFYELGIVDDEDKRLDSGWYNLENAKNQFTKRLQKLVEEREMSDCFNLFLYKIFNVSLQIIDTENSFSQRYSSEMPKNLQRYEKEEKYEFNWKDDKVMGIILDLECLIDDDNKLLDEKEYLKLKQTLQNTFNLYLNSNFYNFDSFGKDITVFDNILFLKLAISVDINMDDIVFNNVRYLFIKSEKPNFDDKWEEYNDFERKDYKSISHFLQKKYFPKLHHLVLEVGQFKEELKDCDLLQIIEILEVIPTEYEDFDEMEQIVQTLKLIIPTTNCLRFCVVPQNIYDLTVEEVKKIYNLEDRNYIISIQNESYSYYYEQCWE